LTVVEFGRDFRQNLNSSQHGPLQRVSHRCNLPPSSHPPFLGPIRISLFGTYREKYNQAFNFDPHFYNPVNAPAIDVDGSATQQPGALIPGVGNPFDGIVQCGKNGVPVSCMKGHLFNPAPRARDLNQIPPLPRPTPVTTRYSCRCSARWAG
jgi:hypothetical protein